MTMDSTRDPGTVDADHQARMMLMRACEPGDLAVYDLVARRGAIDVAEALLRGCSGLRNAHTLRSRLPESATAITEAVSADMRAAERTGARLIVPGDPQWPSQLDDLGVRAPLGLWVMGSAHLRLMALRSVAIVGARSATSYGEALARTTAATLAHRGWLVVSGGAFGIDAAAHRGALDAGGASACVLAGGVDMAYPRSHEALLSRMVTDGLVISESAMGSAALRQRFLARNRIIAALTRGTVVVEAAIRSGSRTTAREAASMLRPVMAFPGPVTSPMSAGCHELVRDRQAILVTCPEDIESMLSSFVEPDEPDASRLPFDDPSGDEDSGDSRQPSSSSTTPGASAEGQSREDAVLAALCQTRARELDRLVVRTRLSPTDVVVALGLLEAQGLVARVGHGWRKVAEPACPSPKSDP
jgi:DNA processing protein